MNHVKDVAAADFATEVIARSHEVPVLVDFWAEWCGPCKVLGPTLERLAGEAQGSWELAKVDVDQNQQLASQFGVQGIPTVVAFRDGQIADRFTGALPEAQVRQFVDSLLPSELDMTAEQGLLLLEAGDTAGAEAAFRAVLESDPAHEVAGIAMAGTLLDRSDRDGALLVLSRLAPTEAVRQMAAIARLAGAGDPGELEAAAAAGQPEARLDLAVALAAAGDQEKALEALLELVAEKSEISDQARLTMLDLFEILGPDDPLTAAYRRRLASALF
ncbi:MAG: thioredoxin [Acidimicrobiia bacterium]|nr:thioredoxin [Acidimicrobiia bacterium]